MVEKKTIFPEVTHSLGAAVAVSVALLGTLYFLSLSSSEPVFPIYMYLIAGGLFSYLLVNTSKYGKIKEALGLSAPFPGYNLLMGISGLGIALILAPITNKLATIYQGQKFAMSLVRPLYIPQLSQPYAISFNFGPTGNGIFFIFVAVIETFMVILLFKNNSGWLYDHGVRKIYAFLIGFNIAGAIFGLFHMFSWSELTLGSVLVAMIFNNIFFASYFFADFIGILSPKERIQFSSILTGGAIGAHWGWDYLVMYGSPFGLEGSILAGTILFLLSMGSMKMIRRVL